MPAAPPKIVTPQNVSKILPDVLWGALPELRAADLVDRSQEWCTTPPNAQESPHGHSSLTQNVTSAEIETCPGGLSMLGHVLYGLCSLTDSYLLPPHQISSWYNKRTERL